jgi:Flp pilus assembly secretin CpaC
MRRQREQEYQMRVHLRRGGLIVTTLAALGAAGPGMAAEEVIDVTIDFGKVLKLEQSEEEASIIVGNPGIADVEVNPENKRVIVLTGKTAGTTNLILLDKEGNEIANYLLRVSSDIRQLTTVFYGASRQTFSCAPVCEQVISVGDNKDKFEAATSQINTRKEFAAGK